MEKTEPYPAQPQWTAAPAQPHPGYPPAQQQSPGYPQAQQQNPRYPQAFQPNSGYPQAHQHPMYTIPAQEYPGYLPSQPNVVVVTHSSSYPSGQNVQPLPPVVDTSNNRRNTPQGYSVGIASLIFITGGMNIAWSFGFGSFYPLVYTHLRISWFIGAIIGAILGAIAAKMVQKKFILIGSAFLVIIGGILFISDPLNIDALIAARYLNGIANGFTFAPSLIMIGEEVVKQNRGLNAASVEAFAVSTGIFLQLMLTPVWGNQSFHLSGEFGATKTHGLFSIVFGVVAFFSAIFLTIESPVFFLQRNDEQAAIDCLRRLQNPKIVTQETYMLLEEHKRYIAENNEMSVTNAFAAALPALIKLCFYRGLVAMSFGFFMGYALIIGSMEFVSYPDFIWPLLAFGGLRWISSFISRFIMDSAGRKMQMLVATIVCAGMAIGTSVIYGQKSDIYITAFLLFVYQFFAGFFTCSSSAYLTEAFPLAVKPYCLSIVYIVEMIVNIIIGTCTVDHINQIITYFYALGSLLVAFFVFAIVSMPETRRDTLREAQAKFRRFKHTNFN